MKRYVTDTQCLLWYLAEDRHLPRAVRRIFAKTEDSQAQVLVPSITLVEAIFLLQRQRVTQEVVDQLLSLSEDPGDSIYVAPSDKQVATAAGEFGSIMITDLPDRVIAATARVHGLPLLTTDHAIAASGLVEVVG